MSFVDQYLKNPLEPLTEQAKNNLVNLENELKDMTSDTSGFDGAIGIYGPQILDIVNRFKASATQLAPFSFNNIPAIFRFVTNIAVEVYQIVQGMENVVVRDSMTADEKHKAKVEFGQSLIYFIWMAVNPIGKYLNWVPFKKTIEKKLVYWLSGMALNSVVDMFAVMPQANTGIIRGF